MTTHVLFDFFGTLVNYSPSRTEQGYEGSFELLQAAGSKLDYQAFLSLWSEVSAEFDEVAEPTHREFSMLDLGRVFLRRAIATPADSIAGDFVQTYVAEWNKGVRYFEELPAMLARLSRTFKLAVITNTHDADLVPFHLGRMGVTDLFGHVITSVEVGKRKPAPETFQHALGVLQVEAEDCIYVGDSYETDYAGARSAGIRGLLIDPRCTEPIDPLDRLQSLFQLEGLLGRRPTSRCSCEPQRVPIGLWYSLASNMVASVGRRRRCGSQLSAPSVIRHRMSVMAPSRELGRFELRVKVHQPIAVHPMRSPW